MSELAREGEGRVEREGLRDVGSFLEQQPHEVVVPLAGGHVEGSVAFVVHVIQHRPPDSLLQQLVPHRVGPVEAGVVEWNLNTSAVNISCELSAVTISCQL